MALNLCLDGGFCGAKCDMMNDRKKNSQTTHDHLYCSKLHALPLTSKKKKSTLKGTIVLLAKVYINRF